MCSWFKSTNTLTPIQMAHSFTEKHSRTIYISGCLRLFSTPHLFDRLGWLSKLPKWVIPFSTFLCSVCIYLPCCLITLRSLQESHLSLVQHANEQNILLLWFFTISVLHNTWHNIYNYHDCCGNNCNVYLHKGTSTYAITKIWDVFCTHKIESKHSCTQQKRKTNNGQLSA